MTKRRGKTQGKYRYLPYIGFKEGKVCKGKIQVLAEYPNAKKKKILGKLHKRYRLLEKMLVDLNKFDLELRETFVDYDKQAAYGYNCMDKWYVIFGNTLHDFKKSIKSQIIDIVQPAFDKWQEKNYNEKEHLLLEDKYRNNELVVEKLKQVNVDQRKEAKKEFILERYKELSKELADLAKQAVEEDIEL